MTLEKSVFSQIVGMIHPQQFSRCVERYGGHYKVRKFSCWDQFLCMAFAQVTYRESLRDIEACLTARPASLYHMGFCSKICRSTLADANQMRDWRIYCDLASSLIAKARRLFAAEDLGIDLEGSVYALDSTTIDLCLSLFAWAGFRKTKAAIKLHTLLDLRGPIPNFIEVTEGKVHDVNALDSLLIEPGSFYVMDRGYLDFGRLYLLKQAGGHFVTRAKDNLRFVRHTSQPVDCTSGLRSDQIGVLHGAVSRSKYPDKLRRIHYRDPETDKAFIFLTNHLLLPAAIICQLYKLRWRVELFFKWIKQHLRIKAFYGTSSNAVKTQVWIAICVYLLIAIMKKERNIPLSLHSILQVLSVNVFEQVPMDELLMKSDSMNPTSIDSNQLIFSYL